jgi:hypothetical protein
MYSVIHRKLQQPDVLYFLVELENLIISSLFHTSLVLSEFSRMFFSLLNININPPQLICGVSSSKVGALSSKSATLQFYCSLLLTRPCAPFLPVWGQYFKEQSPCSILHNRARYTALLLTGPTPILNDFSYFVYYPRTYPLFTAHGKRYTSERYKALL